MRQACALILVLASCGSPEAAAPVPSSAASTPPPTTAAPTPPTTVAAAAWVAPTVGAAAPDGGASCVVDAAPLTIAEGDIALAINDTDSGPGIRIAHRGEVVHGLACTRAEEGSAEIGTRSTPTSRTLTLGTTPLLLVEETGVASAEGQHDDFVAVWVFDADMHLLDVVIGYVDDGPVDVQDDTLRAGRERRVLRDGHLVTPS